MSSASDDPRVLYRAFVAACAPQSGESLPTVLPSPWDLPLGAAERALLTRDLRFPRVLVAGCGRGREIRTLLELGAQVTALDREPAMVAHVQAHFAAGGVEVVASDIGDCVHLFGDAGFDTVVTMGLVSGGIFLPGEDRQARLQAMRRVLRPDGVLLLDFMEHEEREEHKAEAGVGEVRYFDYPLPQGRHVRGCCYWPTRLEMRRELVQAGFGVRLTVLTHAAGERRMAAICRRG